MNRKLVFLLLSFSLLPSSFVEQNRISIPPAVKEETLLGSSSASNHILFLSSNNLDNENVVNGIAGFKQGFDDVYSIDYSFLNIRSEAYDDTKKQAFAKETLDKINSQGYGYQAVFAFKDEALDFVLDYNDSLFGNVPVVFSGVVDKNLTNRAFAKNGIYCGIPRSDIYFKNFEATLDIITEAKKIVYICDSNRAGEIENDLLIQAFNNFVIDHHQFNSDLMLERIIPSDYTTDSLKSIFKSFTNDNIYLYVTMVGTKDYSFYAPDIKKFINENAAAPIFTTRDWGIDDCFIGGYGVDNFSLCQESGLIMKNILKGEITKSTSYEDTFGKYKFDSHVFDKFGLNIHLVPQESELVNYQQDFLEKYYMYVIPCLILILMVLVFIVYFFVEYYKKNKQNTLIKGSEKKLAYLASHDYISGLCNRKTGMEAEGSLIASNIPFALILIDFDDFGKINYEFGHDVGDSTIRQIGNSFKALADGKKVNCYHYGEDKFIFIYKSDDEVEISKFLTTLENWANQELLIGMIKMHLSFRIACSLFPKDGTDSTELENNIEMTMRYLKNISKEKVLFFNDDINQIYTQEEKIQSKINSCLSENGFKIVYQPQVDLNTGSPSGYEALIRIKDNSYGPSVFIPVAEKTGQIFLLTRYVIKTVLQDIAYARDKYHVELPPIAVNISGLQLKDHSFLDFTRRLFNQYQIRKDQVDFEITESSLLLADENMNYYMDFVSEEKPTLALDDFGAGYSSINTLFKVPFTFVKLDKSLTDKVLSIHKQDAIVNLIKFIHSLGAKVIAEGVESKEQMVVLKENGCDIIQGFYFDKALDFEIIISNHFKVYDVSLS